MAIPLTCPSCKHKFKAPDSFEGRKVKCPECAEVIKVKEKTKTKVARSVDDEDDERVQLIRVEEPPPPRVALGLGLPSLILGILATIFLSLQAFLSNKFLAGFDYLSLPFSGLGLILGIASLVFALVQRQGMAFPLTSISLCLTALVGGVFWLNVGPKFRAIEKTIQAVDLPTQEVAAAPKEKKAEPPPPDVKWFDASKEVIRQGDLEVSIQGVAVNKVKTKGILEGEQLTQHKHLGILVQVRNLSKAKKVDFRGWSGAAQASGGADLKELLEGVKQGGLSAAMTPEASVWDDNNNNYSRRQPELGETIEGQVMGKAAIYPGKAESDLILFEEPVDKVKYLHVELDASAYGGVGKLRFQIPAKMIQR